MVKETSSNKSEEKVRKNVSLVNIELFSINGQKLSIKDKKDSFKFNRRNTLDLVEINDQEVKIKLTERLYFSPEGPFKLDFEVIGLYETDIIISSVEVLENIEMLAEPLFSYSSHIISMMTERFVNIPIIVPPNKTKD